MKEKSTILIVDDSELNRTILADILGDEYNFIEAENGARAIELLRTHTDIDLILLDMVMPEMNGFDVLTAMNNNRQIEDIPVVMISAENGIEHIERAYDLGVTDYISRPFDRMVVHRRVVNALILAAKQKRLMRLAAEQIYEKEKISDLMINIFSHIVEFRNGESGPHVLHIRTITEVRADGDRGAAEPSGAEDRPLFADAGGHSADLECVRAARYRQGQYSG